MKTIRPGDERFSKTSRNSEVAPRAVEAHVLRMSEPRLERIYLSAGHNYFGHHGQPPGDYAAVEVERVNCVAGRGLEGDRFFDFKRDYKGQVTFFALEVHRWLSAKLGVHDRPPAVFRRNLLTSGVDLEALIGVEFEFQGVRFAGTAECKPCYWMESAFGAGAEEALSGRGGLRAKILSDGPLQVGPATLRILDGTLL
jgi:MOSC domain-containing protein YiiM